MEYLRNDVINYTDYLVEDGLLNNYAVHQEGIVAGPSPALLTTSTIPILATTPSRIRILYSVRFSIFFLFLYRMQCHQALIVDSEPERTAAREAEFTLLYLKKCRRASIRTSHMVSDTELTFARQR